MMSLAEASFHVAAELERISKEIGRRVKVLHVDSWSMQPDSGNQFHMSVDLQLDGGQEHMMACCRWN
jgi:hypothetical protein